MYVSRNVEILGRKFLPQGQMKNRAMLLNQWERPLSELVLILQFVRNINCFHVRRLLQSLRRRRAQGGRRRTLNLNRRLSRLRKTVSRSRLLTRKISCHRWETFNLFDTCSLLLGSIGNYRTNCYTGQTQTDKIIVEVASHLESFVHLQLHNATLERAHL